LRGVNFTSKVFFVEATTLRKVKNMAELTPGTWNFDPAHSEIGFTVRPRRNHQGARHL
jgi:polyisoprenoid-binding protein YceI